jgi:hypothetical protein
MTPAKVQLVQDSFRKVVPMADAAADFSMTGCSSSPRMCAACFRKTSEQKKKLMQMLATAVANLQGRLARPFAYPARTLIDRLCLPSVWLHCR